MSATVVVYARPDRPEALEWARRAYERLRALGARVYYEASIAGLLSGPGLDVRLEEFDKAVVIGGDGTLLRFLHLAGEKTPVIHPVRLGRRAFLFEHIPPGEMLELLAAFLEDRYRVESLPRLWVEHRGWRSIALNEAAVLSMGSKTVSLRVVVDGSPVYRGLEGDGVIIATPAGSTAYNYSSGGPVIHPRLRAVALTPVNPVERQAGSLVVPGGSRVEVLVERTIRPVKLVVDGVEERLLYQGAVVAAWLGAPEARLARYREEPEQRLPWLQRCSC